MDQTAKQASSSPDGRQQARTHFFVAGTLYAGGGSTPVTIRNMSRHGALIEAAELPDVDELVTLKRGHLSAAGSIAWRVHRKAGVRLNAAVHVPDWMSRQVSADQERVDALVSIARGDTPKATAFSAPQSSPVSLKSELRQLRLELSSLESALLKDVIMVATHPEIQTIDISLQRIDRILKSLRGGG